MAASSLFAFHLQVGARVALRMFTPVLAAAAAAAVLYGSPAVIFAPLVALLSPASPSLTAGLLATVLSTALAGFALRRLSLGLGGWIRHLPADGVAHRRAVTAGLVAAQAPLLLLLGGTGIAAWSAAPGPSLVRLVGVVPCAWGSCLAVLRVQRVGARLLAVAAAVGAFSGALAVLPAALAFLAVAEITAGPLRGAVTGRSPAGRHVDPLGTARATRGDWAALRLTATTSWRALRWRIFASWCLAAPALLPAALFVRNNDLLPAHRVGAARLAGVAAAVLVIAWLGDQLATRRPQWPWVRSLPWSALTRAGHDAALLLGATVPVTAAAAALAPEALPALLATSPLLALRGAAAIRKPRTGPWGASGPLVAEGALAGMLVTLVPWLAVAALALTPLAALAAERAEQRRSVGQWNELQHLALGDPLSWSGR